MTGSLARRLSAESDRYGDGFFEARKAWLDRGDASLREQCLAAAALYATALRKEIEHLESLDDSEEVATALKRAKMYERLLRRQLIRVKGDNS